MAALTPGLKVKVEATYNTQNQLVATKVTFKGNDLQQAEAIQAGTQPAKAQIQQTQQELDQQRAALEQQQQAMQQQEMTAAHAKMAAHKAAIEEANKRFGQLDDYNILDEVTVYFGNGKVALDPTYQPRLLPLAEKAKGNKWLHDPGKGLCLLSGRFAAQLEPNAPRSVCPAKHVALIRRSTQRAEVFVSAKRQTFLQDSQLCPDGS